MARPTMLELAIKEWGILRDLLLDHYCAAVPETHDGEPTREYSPDFIWVVWDLYNIDLRRMKPVHPDSIDSVLRESKALSECIEEVQDDESELMVDFYDLNLDPDVLMVIIEGKTLVGL